MKRISLVVTLSLAVVLVGAGYFGLSAFKEMSPPKYSGEHSLSGLKAPAKISFDHWGVPHIKAKSESDAYRALGYVMAQDRLFQMDLLRRLAKGELAEVFGEKALKTDKLFRTLSLTRPFKNKERDPDVERIMTAFYEGINEFIKEQRWPFEYTLMGFEPRPFELLDGHAVLGYMAYSFAMGFKTDPFFTELESALGPEVLNSLRGNPLPEMKEQTVSVPQKKGPSLWREGHLFGGQIVGYFTGSNAWALAPERSQSGHALLASDPHVAYSLPGLWYEAHLSWNQREGEGSSKKEFYGHFVPLLPFPALAHSINKAWGVTISYIDDLDFIEEEIEADSIVINNKAYPLETEKHQIKVKDQNPLSFDVQWGPRGPIVNHLFEAFKEKAPVSLLWGHYHPKNQPALAFYRMLNSENREDFKEAMALGKSPGVNVVYADKEGHIGRYIYGSYPKRARFQAGDTLIKSTEEAHIFSEEVPFQERPHIENPADGQVVSANQKPEGTPLLYAGYFQPEDRYETIKTILSGRTQWSMDELKVVQTADVNVFYLPMKEQMLKALSQENWESSTEKKALAILDSWDGQSARDSQGALVFHSLLKVIERKQLAFLNEEQYFKYCETNAPWHRFKRKIFSDNPPEIFIESFKEVAKSLKEKWGSPSQWKWGQVHQLEIKHPFSKASDLLGAWLNHGPFPMEGAFHQINNMRPIGCKDGHTVKAGPSTRRLISFENPAESWGILPMGNSGHYGSPFYDNQWELFHRHDYRPQIMRELKKSETFSKLTLKPR